MLRNVLDNRMAVIGAVVALSLILSGSVVGIHSAISAEGDAWPAFTMTYEVDGTAIGVGDATYQGREVHRLEYRTGKDWVDTVIAAPSVDTVAGPVSAVARVGLGPVFPPAQGRFGHGAVHTQPTPVQPLQFVSVPCST